jgi:hypothetical protein
MGRQTQTDARSDYMKREMAEHFAANEGAYRDTDWGEIVYEDDEVVVVSDHKGYEFSAWKSEFANEEFSQIMHDLARDVYGGEWSVYYPVVFDKLEDD